VDGERQRVLPVTNTSRPVDLDLVNNTLRLPYRQRLSLILNEFGAGWPAAARTCAGSSATPTRR
jgi:hypothetical protein